MRSLTSFASLIGVSACINRQIEKRAKNILKRFEQPIIHHRWNSHQLGVICIRRKSKLRPQIFRYLDEKGNTNFDILVNELNKTTGVSTGKIEFRIKKLASKGELLITKGIVSRIIPSKNNMGQRFDEIHKLGPITLGRRDNVITIKSDFGKKDIVEFHRNAKKNLPILKKDVDQKLKEIEASILENFDPLDVVAYVASKNLLVNPETYTESSFEGKQLCPEIVQNIVLKNDLKKYTGTDRNGIGKINEQTNKLFLKLNHYLLVEALARDDLTLSEGEVYFHVINNFLLIRGDAYPQHYREVASELFSKINDALKSKGYTIEEYWSTVEEIDRQIRYNFNEPVKMLHLEHEKYREFFKKEVEKGTKLSEIALKGNYEIEINDEINQKLLDSLSMRFGENRHWTSPLDKSDIAIRPIVRANNKYYCFLTPHLTRNVISIIESQLSQNDRDRVGYSDLKGNYFEAKAIQLLDKVLGGKAYSNLSYPKGNEIDGIIVLGNLVFLIEVKGKKKRIVAGVSDVLKLTKEDFKAHVADAYDQTKRAFEYIQGKDEVEFKDKKGIVALTLRKAAISKIYQINVSLENFSKLALDINLVKSWAPNLMKGEDYPWIVSIYDLIIISDLLEKERDAFITYLNERLMVAKSSSLEAIDEIDYLGYFLENGNLDRLKDLKPATFALIHGFSEGIDRWYSYLRGEVAQAEKPVLKK